MHILYIFVLKSCMDVRVGPQRRLSAEELMFSNCGVGEDLWVPWTARTSNQSILREIKPEYSLEGLMLKLKLQHFGHLMQRANSLERTRCWERLKAKGEESGRGWDGWMTSLMQWIHIWSNSGKLWRTRKSGVLQSTGSQRVEHDLVIIQILDTINWHFYE